MRTNAPAVATVAIGLAIVGCVSLFSLTLALAGVLVLLAMVAAYTWPVAAMALALVAVVLVPTYWVPDIPGTRVAVLPVAVACFVLLPVALQTRPQLRVLVADKLVMAYAALAAVSYLLNAEGSLGSILSLGLSVVLPYATFRLLGVRADAQVAAGVGVVISGVVSAIVAIREYNGVPNPFFEYFPSGHLHAFFIRTDERLGHARPEAAFGLAIALGMFLCLAAIVALGLAWRSGGTRRFAIPLYGAAAVILWGLVNNLVRGPLLMFAFALTTLIITESRRGRHSRGLFVAGALVVLVNIGAFANVFELRDATLEEGSRVQRSGEYRVEIWRVVADLDNFSLFGRPVDDPEGLGFVKAAGVQVGIKSFDNAYALIYIGFGALALAAFVGLALWLARTAFTPGLAVIDHAWAAALLAAFINLMTVNLLTQFAHIFWIGVALVVAARQRSDDLRDSDAAAELGLAPSVRA